MLTLHDWKIERSGPGLRIVGMASGENVKVTDITSVMTSPVDGQIVALRGNDVVAILAKKV